LKKVLGEGKQHAWIWQKHGSIEHVHSNTGNTYTTKHIQKQRQRNLSISSSVLLIHISKEIFDPENKMASWNYLSILMEQ
jgi:uncharacterized protein YfiM (DUF2279 family)